MAAERRYRFCEEVLIEGETYLLAAAYQEEEGLRQSFCQAAEEVFHLDFESWYQQGWWKDNYIPYSIIRDGQVLANVSVNPLTFSGNGITRHYVQLGTVLTRKEHRGKGFARVLMERVIDDWSGQCEAIYLYANNSVLNFYPRFGFQKETEYLWCRNIQGEETEYPQLRVMPFDPRQQDQRDLLERLASLSRPYAALELIHNVSLLMFYVILMEEEIYYLPDLSCIVMAEKRGHTWHITEVLAEEKPPVSLVQIAQLISKGKAEGIELGFMPQAQEGFESVRRETGDDTLFVLETKEAGSIFRNQRVRLPELSHT